MPTTHQTPTRLFGLTEDIQAKLAKLNAHVLEKILRPPVRGEGHRELYRDACALKRAERAKFTEAEIKHVLQARFAGYYRDLPERDYDEAIRNASDAKSGPPAPKWPPMNAALIEAAIKKGGSVEKLAASSPVAEPHLLSSGDVIDRLFPNGGLLCFGDVRRQAVTDAREWFRGREADLPYIVPNPMLAKSGMTRDRRPSARCSENSRVSLYQVVEFDNGSLDEQAARLLDIKDRGVRLRMVVHSGGKSLHGWFEIRDLPDEELVRLRRYAAALGGDPATFTACQFVRTPQALRENGNLQKVIFLS